MGFHGAFGGTFWITKIYCRGLSHANEGMKSPKKGVVSKGSEMNLAQKLTTQRGKKTPSISMTGAGPDSGWVSWGSQSDGDSKETNLFSPVK